MINQENILNKSLKILIVTLILSWLIILSYYGIFNLIRSIPDKLTSSSTIDIISKTLSTIANNDKLDIPVDQKKEIGSNLNKIYIKVKPIIDEIKID
jgi:hypothetical protein|tara:strand:+ start:53 stop:343 length:291 start_codon:yes stop_codon:yes gene_type:complete